MPFRHTRPPENFVGLYPSSEKTDLWAEFSDPVPTGGHYNESEVPFSTEEFPRGQGDQVDNRADDAGDPPLVSYSSEGSFGTGVSLISFLGTRTETNMEPNMKKNTTPKEINVGILYQSMINILIPTKARTIQRPYKR